jgi:molybdate transport system ATP-binding protein
MDPNILLKLEGITARLGASFLLHDTTWEIRRGEHWAVLGPNGAGKSTLVRILTGDTPHVRGRVSRNSGNGAIGYVSFELQERILAREDARDAGRSFARSWDDLEKARDTIRGGWDGEAPEPEKAAGLFDRLGITGLLDRPVRLLSAGEIRKVLIARALLADPTILVLDEPFAGLDGPSRETLLGLMRGAMESGIQMILVTHRGSEIPGEITHVLGVRGGRVAFQGPREDMLTPERVRSLYGEPEDSHPALSRAKIMPPADSDAVIEMKDVTIRFGDVTVLDGVSWTVRRGERWAVIGPNGSGKTTLMRLITADHPQAYANEIRLFGRLRGSGESIWEIKKRIGLVSSEFQLRYRLPIGVLDVILSGFFDSVGLYCLATERQVTAAKEWMSRFGIGPLAGRMFDTLSYGERRLALLARAMVKEPELLVLDEPCQGLDRINRRRILDAVDQIADAKGTTVLFVTHRPTERPASIDRTLSLTKPAVRPGGTS